MLLGRGIIVLLLQDLTLARQPLPSSLALALSSCLLVSFPKEMGSVGELRGAVRRGTSGMRGRR